jgi:hypothetical protein
MAGSIARACAAERAPIARRIAGSAPFGPSIPAIAVLPVALAPALASPEPAGRLDRAAVAADAARWIRTPRGARDGTRWPANPEVPGPDDASLYAGSPGVILFLIAMHRASGRAHPRRGPSGGDGS